MSLYCAQGSLEADLSSSDVEQLLSAALEKVGLRWKYYGDCMQAVLRALGTHTPMRRRG
jgi:hypothetical protein